MFFCSSLKHTKLPTYLPTYSTTELQSDRMILTQERAPTKPRSCYGVNDVHGTSEGSSIISVVTAIVVLPLVRLLLCKVASPCLARIGAKEDR